LCFTRLYSAISQKIEIFIATAVITSNPAFYSRVNIVLTEADISNNVGMIYGIGHKPEDFPKAPKIVTYLRN
jgi:hypothetical protein